MKPLFIFVSILALLASSPVKSQVLYVSPLGNDKNPGTKAKPIASFAKAQQLVRALDTRSKVKVIFAKGTYYLPETIRFTEMDNKTSVVYTSEKEGDAVISGGSLLKLKWTFYERGIYKASVPPNTVIDQLYINGVRQRMARFPNAISGKNVFDAWDLNHEAKPDSISDALSSKHIAQWKNPAGGYIHAMHAYLWGDMHWVIKGKNADGTLIEEGGWQNNRPSPKHPVFRMVENIFEELDTEGEWFFNGGEGMLYYIPAKGTDLATAKVEIVRLKQLIEFSGSKEHPVNNIELKGFVFRHTARTFMENKEPLLRSDWTVFRGGAIFFNGAESCRITDCEFDQVGGNAVFVNKYNRHISIKGCYIHHAGANGVSFVGDPATVRSPIFRYGNQNFQTMDRTPGAIGDNFPEDCQVEDCLITMTGRDEKQTAPIQISISHKITVSHCSIYDVPRAGINISEGTFGEHIIQDCDIFNTVFETGDHGSFNSWGRDRYWTPDTRETDKEVAKEKGLPYLDMLGPNILRHNRWRCDHGWDIDLDDGSSWYRIYNNLLLNGGLKMREGFDRIATNNIIINNGLHPHVWYLNSGDVFSKNIVFKAYQPAIMDNSIPATGKWGKELDYNFYVGDSSERIKFRQNSCDLNSLNGDPLFIDPSKGDFRVNSNSSALKTGFVNFSMNDFGVVKPSLKAIAKQPKIPQFLSLVNNQKGPSHPQYAWMGISLIDPVGDQWSAYGVSSTSGGVALSNVLENSPVYKLGFRSNDLIQEINGVPTRNAGDLKKFFDGKAGVKTYSIMIIRKQQPLHLTINQELPSVE